MSAFMASSAVLRSPPVRGVPVRIGCAPDGESVASCQEDPAEAAVRLQMREGYARGFAEGRAEGREKGHAEGLLRGAEESAAHVADEIARQSNTLHEELQAAAAAERERLESMAAALHETRSQALAHAEETLACLALELAAKVLGPLLVTAEGVRAQVRVLLASVSGPVSVRVRPDLVEELSAIARCGDIRWIADERVKAGVILEQGGLRLDAQLQTILDRLHGLLALCVDEGARASALDAERP